MNIHFAIEGKRIKDFKWRNKNFVRDNSVNSKSLLAAKIITREIRRYLLIKKDNWNLEGIERPKGNGTFTFGKQKHPKRMNH